MLTESDDKWEAGNYPAAFVTRKPRHFVYMLRKQDKNLLQ